MHMLGDAPRSVSQGLDVARDPRCNVCICSHTGLSSFTVVAAEKPRRFTPGYGVAEENSSKRYPRTPGTFQAFPKRNTPVLPRLRTRKLTRSLSSPIVPLYPTLGSDARAAPSHAALRGSSHSRRYLLSQNTRAGTGQILRNTSTVHAMNEHRRL